MASTPAPKVHREGGCSRTVRTDRIDSLDLAAIYFAHIMETDCQACEFGRLIATARRENAQAAQTEWARIGHMNAVHVSCGLGDTSIVLDWQRDDHRLDESEARTLATSLDDAGRTILAREAIQKRVSEPICVEDRCLHTPIGWLEAGFTGRVPRDVERGIPARNLTRDELARCEQHQPKADA